MSFDQAAAGHHYQGLRVGGSARLHNGDVYNSITSIKNERVKFSSLSVEQRNEKLLKTAKEGQIRQLELLIQAGADINVTSPSGTPLIVVTKHGHKAVAQLFLDKRADLEETDRHGDTALQHAAAIGCADLVRISLVRGANIEAIDPDGMTALHQAGKGGNEEIFKILLANGAREDAVNINHKTAQWLLDTALIARDLEGA